MSEKIFEDQWKTNTLFTGATPYKNCFGGNPRCYPPSGYRECSSIRVIAPVNSNVIVTVKKSGSVYKHAYTAKKFFYCKKWMQRGDRKVKEKKKFSE